MNKPLSASNKIVWDRMRQDKASQLFLDEGISSIISLVLLQQVMQHMDETITIGCRDPGKPVSVNVLTSPRRCGMHCTFQLELASATTRIRETVFLPHRHVRNDKKAAGR
jgi:hypothetical protein